MGPRPFKSLQRNSCSAAFRSLHKSYNPHRGRLFAREGNLCIANVASSLHPLITGGPYLVQPDSQGQVTVAVKNFSPINLELQCNDFIGSVENVQDCETREVNTAYLQAITQQ
jgi:hypothetical protein